jgi:hypothetical protein
LGPADDLYWRDVVFVGTEIDKRGTRVVWRSGGESGTESLAFLGREYPHVESCMNDIDIEHAAQGLWESMQSK